jgi:hypothetical protein
MDCKSLQRHHKELSQMHEEFLEADYDYRNGKNKKIRDDGSRRTDIVLTRFESYVMQSAGLFDYLTEGHGEDFGRTIYWDELKSFRYFGRDMGQILRKMRSDCSE